MSREMSEKNLEFLLDDGILRMPGLWYCEKCGRPNVGTDRCPHAMNPKFMCPRDREAREFARKLRRLGL